MSSRNLAKNTVFYSLALAGQKVLSFIYFIFLARIIGVENQGKFSFALSFTSIFAMFLDLGLTQILIRDSAKDKNCAELKLANVISFKLLYSFIIYGFIVLLINLMRYPEITKQLVYISGLVMLLDSFSLSVYGVIRGHHNLLFESIGTILNQLVVLIVGLIGLYWGWGLKMLMFVYLLASFINLIWAIYHLNKSFKIKIILQFNWQIINQLLILSIPFAIAGIFTRIFSSIDTVLLSKLAGDWAVGIYSVAFKAVFALQFLALAFSASLYPAFSNYFVHSKENLAKLFTKSMYWLIFASLPLTSGTIAIADKVIKGIFGNKYLPSIEPLQILITSIVFVFLCFPIGALLNACNQQTRNTINLGIVAIFSFITNLILIPIYNYNGSAITNLLSYGLLFILGILAVNQIIDYDKKFLFFSFLKSLLASCIMFLVVFSLKELIHFVILIPIGILIYLSISYLMGLFSINSIKEFSKEFIK